MRKSVSTQWKTHISVTFRCDSTPARVKLEETEESSVFDQNYPLGKNIYNCYKMNNSCALQNGTFHK